MAERLKMKKESLRAAARRTGIGYQTLYARMRRRGITLEEAIEWGKNDPNERYQHYDGRPNLSAVARKTGIKIATIWWRINEMGMTLEEAIDAGKPPERHKRNVAKINETAKRTGLTESGVRMRMEKFGISEDGAAALGPKISGRHKKIIVLDFTHLRPRDSIK